MTRHINISYPHPTIKAALGGGLRNIEVHLIINVVGLGLAQVPGDVGGPQTWPGEAPVQRLGFADDADIHRALLENPWSAA
jgi:hypothetical protein